jgi:Protein of unknown function (DUF1524)/Excalibur calcium-binding domain
MRVARSLCWLRYRVARRRCAAALLTSLVIAGCGATASTNTTPSVTTATTTAHLERTGPAAGPTATTTHSSTSTSPAATPARRQPLAQTGTALAALEALPVKGRAPKTGYSRDQFGDGWASVAGCDTRDRILARDLTQKMYVAGDDCRIQSGVLRDPYTAQTIMYVRGGASEVDVDHVVALGDAWQKGAQQWSQARREVFANDPLELLAVSSTANRAKGDGDAATWLPSNKRFRCDYVARQIAVKQRYGLWVTPAEHDAMARVLSRCPGQQLPKSSLQPPSVVSTQPAIPVRQSQARTSTAPANTNSGQGRVFANCAAVRAAGLAPLRAGTPDYRANERLDRDKDGLACE